VIIAWFRPLDESFDGPDYTNERYFMIVNGLGHQRHCGGLLAEIKLNFISSASAVSARLVTGVAQTQTLPVVSARRQLVLSLSGGDAALFQDRRGAFVGVPVAARR
jgi:hypothetical protein